MPIVGAIPRQLCALALLALHACREEAPAGFVPFVKPPPEFESEVADNLLPRAMSSLSGYARKT